MPVLTAIDVVGIQSYIFASNRLRDVVGASYLVEWATSRHGGLRLDNGEAAPPDVLMAAGGNAILRFPTSDAAKRFALYYSRRLLERAPGLDVAIAHQPYDDPRLADGLLALQIKIAKAKLDRRPHSPQLGLSIMEPCAITGLPASEQSTTPESQWISARIARSRDPATIQAAKERWRLLLGSADNLPAEICARGVTFPDELDQMGRTRGDTSLIGIVHVDGNGIGKRIQRWLVSKLGSADDAIDEEYRSWSGALESLGKVVFQRVLSRLLGRIEPTGRQFYLRGQPSPPRELDFELHTNPDGLIYLPLRPILLGGDDLTFVCDGRIALDLAAAALRAFAHESARSADLKLLGETPMTACAGVAVVRSHYPFVRGYELSEGLCAAAKLAKRDAEASSGLKDTGCWIDWHRGITRPNESVAEIRERQYGHKELTCRPYPLDGDVSQRLTWDWLDSELLGEPAAGGSNRLSLRNPGIWGERRNKVKNLAGLARDGANAIRRQLEAWSSVAPDLKLPTPINVDGFKAGRTPLLDAVELLDIHLRLDAPK